MADKYSHTSPTLNPQKRKHDSKQQPGPIGKKPRHENGNFQRIYTPPETLTLPSPLPALPPISPEHEKIVFTHPGTAVRGDTSQGQVNYDRLEFLGDAYLEIIASQIIFNTYSTMNVGGMCKLRESVVKNESLSRYTCAYGLDKRLNTLNAPKSWTKVYGDVFEAYAAAVVLSDPEKGESTLKAWLEELWAPMLVPEKVQPPDPNVKVKEELAKKIVCPHVKLSYVEERKPIIHVGKGIETFFIGVFLDGWGWKNQHLGSGEGLSKATAGHAAAVNALSNHPLIDEIAAKKAEYLAERAAKVNGVVKGET